MFGLVSKKKYQHLELVLAAAYEEIEETSYEKNYKLAELNKRWVEELAPQTEELKKEFGW